MRQTPGASARPPNPAEEALWTLPRLLHELRGPLQAMTEGLDGLASRVRGARNRALAARLKATGERVAALLSAAEGDSAVRALSPAALVESVTAETRAGHADRLVEVRCDPATRAELGVDAVALAQATANLVGNALVHASGGAVRVSLARPTTGAPRLVLTVEDDGPGLGLGERRRAFGEGWRGKGSAAAHPTGKGLGLSVVHRLAQAAGGGVVLGAARSGGCRFDVTLPLHDLAARTPGDLRVAIVEDDPACRAAMLRLLKRAGARAWSESTRAGLRRRLERSRADVLVLDRHWQGDAEAGARLARRLRLNDWPGGIVLWSGDIARPGEDFDAVLGKPAGRHQLQQALGEARAAAADRRRLRLALGRRWEADLGRLESTRGPRELGAEAHRWAGVLGLAGLGGLALRARALERACAAGDAAAIGRGRRALIGGLRARRLLAG